MKKQQIYIVSVIIVFIVVIVGILIYWMVYGRYFQSTNDAYIKGNITTISARIDGMVTAVNVEDNASVQPGTLLITLDDKPFKNAQNQAKANLQVKSAQLAALQEKKKVNDDQIAEAKAKIDQAKAQLNQDKKKQHRLTQLNKHDYTSDTLLDSINAQVKVSEAAVKAAQATCNGLEDQVNLINAQIQQMQSMVNIAQLQIKQTTLNLSYTKINSPEAGIVTNRHITAGMNVSAGMPLISLINTDNLWIEANFKETQLRYLKPGQTVTIQTDAYPDKEIIGTIDSITPGTGTEFALLPPNNATGNFTKVVQRLPVKITIADKDKLKNLLYPGLSVEVSVDTR